MSEAYICDALRTPIGRYGGALSTVRADDLAAVPISALMARYPSLDWRTVDDVILGCANQAGEDNRNVARMAALLSGLPVEVPGITVNRLCGSGMEAVGQAARAIRLGEAEMIIAGGVESMSRAPFVMGKADALFSRSMHLEDTTMGWRFVNPRIKTQYGVESMPETAENIADEYHISRRDQDAFALRSQQRAAAAQRAGRFKAETVPVPLMRKGRVVGSADADEHLRPDTRLEQLLALNPVTRADGTITAGNASGLNDGACALLIASKDAAKRHELPRRARIVGMVATGLAPRMMGLGPVDAVTRLLARCNLRLQDIDVIELNEAFAAQALGVLRALGVDEDSDRVNPNGGAIALGHPLGMSGARLVTTALYQLEENGGRLALCTMCVGVGQGIAMIIERI